MKIRIGKSKIDVSVEGCYRCGTLWSSGWYEYKEIPVQVGQTKGSIVVHVCANCVSVQEKETDQTKIAVEGYL